MFQAHARKKTIHDWDAKKLGLNPRILWTTLFDRFNTRAVPIQDDEAFHHDVVEISKEAKHRDQFYTLLEARSRQREEEIHDAFQSIFYELTCSPSACFPANDIGTERWRKLIRISEFKSLDALVAFLQTYVTEEYYERRAADAASDKRIDELKRTRPELFEFPGSDPSPVRLPSYLYDSSDDSDFEEPRTPPTGPRTPPTGRSLLRDATDPPRIPTPPATEHVRSDRDRSGDSAPDDEPMPGAIAPDPALPSRPTTPPASDRSASLPKADPSSPRTAERQGPRRRKQHHRSSDEPGQHHGEARTAEAEAPWRDRDRGGGSTEAGPGQRKRKRKHDTSEEPGLRKRMHRTKSEEPAVVPCPRSTRESWIGTTPLCADTSKYPRCQSLPPI